MSTIPADQLVKRIEGRLVQATERVNELEMKLAEAREEQERLQFTLEEVQGFIGSVQAQIDPAQGDPHRFAGMTKWEAAEIVLRESEDPLGTAEIVDALFEGGIDTKSPRKNFYTAIYNTLMEKAKKPEKYPLRKVGKQWALVKK